MVCDRGGLDVGDCFRDCQDEGGDPGGVSVRWACWLLRGFLVVYLFPVVLLLGVVTVVLEVIVRGLVSLGWAGSVVTSEVREGIPRYHRLHSDALSLKN